MTLTDDQRARMAQFARVMIPGGAGMPSAADLVLWAASVDEVLAIDPTRLKPLVRFLSLEGKVDTLADVEALAHSDRLGFEALGVVLANSYFMHTAVRDSIGYRGQEACDSSGGLTEEDEALLAPVIARGPIYRPV
ncbi:MAG: hypothetical protein JJ908_03525 [Rhizobiales bacterium]|nr:hypothetical protein [Hyphomicrobiales bacterium]MBO6698328.1 hypothetical protein [Hyphomicrobiales bacterium]MBO6735418.1 hypothetical protein [Hyphomicrobiales bacterium]MBO6910774.1 hypothetical protein [Hyphomicrobiales bacterium]MBO6956507.1 hypothetical protein [Hyphomicrobiales bacterium]